ncbi:MAG: arginine--tRNA ligase [Planctomycetota bacterium]
MVQSASYSYTGDMGTYSTQHTIYTVLADALSRATDLPIAQITSQLGRPPKSEMGDYAFPCFVYGKHIRQPPATAAAQLAEKLKADEKLAVHIEKIEAVGPFLNIGMRPGALVHSILQLVLNSQIRYGESREGAGKTIVIDYSAPNIAKPFHVGHLMSTIIGASLTRIFRALGYTVVGVNHLGDWGVQCGFQFLAWQIAVKKFREDPVNNPDPESELRERGLDYLAKLYVEINDDRKNADALEKKLKTAGASKDDPQYATLCDTYLTHKKTADSNEQQARALFKQLEDGDQELKKLWERLRGETLRYLQKSYDRLGVKFDSDAGEGFYEPMLKPLLAELKAKGIAVESEGALVIPMDDAPPKSGQTGRPPFILLKSDEATIYGTRDLAAAIYRQKTYNFHKNLYVVDVRQSGHFQMLFKALSKMSCDWAKDCVHISFGMMQIREGDQVMAMTTRGGSMIPLHEVLDHTVAKVRDIVKEKNPELDDSSVAKVAEAVGVGAIIFWIQARRRASNFVFDWSTATDPAGDTGPYLQYAHARACSILKKSQTDPSKWKSADFALLTAPEEVAVAKMLELYPEVVQQAAKDYEPSLISSYLLNLAGAFGHFLNKQRVIDSPSPLRESRLALVDALRQTLARGLGLLGVAAPEAM